MTTPDVRAAHIAQQAAIHPHDLYGDPHQPVDIYPPIYRQTLDRELAEWEAIRNASMFCGPAPADWIDNDLSDGKT